MMRTQNNILIIDTETVGTFGSPIIHDIGYKIIDKDFNTLVERRHLIKELHEVSPFMLYTSDFYQSKKHLYEEAKATKSVDIIPWKMAVKELMDDMRVYKVKVLSAYNMAFDYKALNATNNFFNFGDYIASCLSNLFHDVLGSGLSLAVLLFQEIGYPGLNLCILPVH